ncbi:glutamyl-tRNA reductase [Lactococcus nasutitermitis]|uniref:Glutamyl-tRNA reductase n=1 Tax=Lactococcus nasutitermitis TaxID=1652957 RepID=A0ABV9JCN8_9LACT|nr:glutamyl-tRNA reductase [Lactococcus nasutitermitis]
MQLLVISLNYKKVPIEIREKLSFSEEELKTAMQALKNEQGILENVILSTCNRTEVYALVDQAHRGEDYIKRFLANWFHLKLDSFKDYVVIYQEKEVVNYLFRVTCGLESLIVGEEQILRQVKASFALAQDNKATGSILNRLFKEAITLSKKVHTETALSHNSVSVGTAAVQLAKQVDVNFHEATCLVIGAGEMSELSAKYLSAQKIGQLMISNRTYSKAEKLAEKYKGKSIALSDLKKALITADVVFSSTSAKDFVITSDLMSEVKKQRKNSSLFLIDLAVPRDIDPDIIKFDGIELYDIDDLQSLINNNVEERHKAEKITEEMILLASEEFQDWLTGLEAVPIISRLQDKGMRIQQQILQTLERKLPELDEHENKTVNKLTKSIVNQILREPILVAKELAHEENAKEKLELFQKIFDLKQENVEEK